MTAKIDVQGVWNRNIPRKWIHKEQGRTDIFKTVLEHPRLRLCRFFFADGPTVVIPAGELRRVVEGGSDHYGGKIWGPFYVNPSRQTVNGRRVQMQVLP